MTNSDTEQEFSSESHLTNLKKEWNDVSWVRARLKQQHHSALAKYLIHRTPEMKEMADKEGLYADVIVAQGFNVERGQVTVSEDILGVLARCEDVNPWVVWGVVQKSTEMKSCIKLQKRLKGLIIKYGSQNNTSPRKQILEFLLEEVSSFIIVRDVMNS